MVSYHDLLHADLEPLREAVTKWRNLPEHFRQIRTNFNTQVRNPLADSNWKGDAADAAEKKMRNVAWQIGEAAGQAEDVHGFLESAYKELKDCRKDLKHQKKIADDDPHMEIDPKGKVAYKPTNLDDLEPGGATAQAKNYRDAVAAANSSIAKILERATTADELLDWALRTDVNGRGKGFSDKGAGSLKEAKRAREQAAKDARETIRLASIDHRELTQEELKKFEALTRKHEGDPYFSEKFATGLGARGTLEFWQRNADEVQTGDERTKTLARIQKSLGFTLATASHSDSDAMRDWKHDVIKLGGRRFDDVDMARSGPAGKGPYGFQIMSSLMRNGEFDRQFLEQYGKGYGSGEHHVKGLLEFDKEASKDGSLKEFYTADGEYQAMLNLGKGGDKGMDPMAGYMEALGRNPEAAQDLFHKKGYEYQEADDAVPNKNLQYLLKDRPWPDGNSLDPNGHRYGYDELGHALEAATLGHAYDQPQAGMQRSAEGANVMSQTLDMVTSDSAFLDKRAGLGESLARMGAGYIDNINAGVSQFGGTPFGDETRVAAFGKEDETDIAVSRAKAAKFLQMVGGDETGYRILSGAEHQFAMNAVKGTPEPNDALTLTLGTGAEAHGILDGARADSIMDEADDSKTEKARKLSEAAEWKKFGFGQTVGSVTSLVTAPLEATRGGAFAVPVIDTLTGSLETEKGIMIDREVERQQKEFDDKIDAQSDNLKAEFRDKGERSSQAPLDAYLTANKGLENGEWHQAAQKELRDGYSRGYGYAK